MGFSEEEARKLQENVLGLSAKKQVGSDTPYSLMIEKNKAILEGALGFVEYPPVEFRGTNDIPDILKQRSLNDIELMLFKGDVHLGDYLLKSIGFLLVPISPMGAVRTTKEGAKFDKRFKAYSQYKDKILAILGYQRDVWGIDIVAYIAAPKSYTMEDGKRKTYTKAERAAMVGQLAKCKPDWDNIAKGVQDACMKEDSVVGLGFCVKRYCADGEERMYVRFRKHDKKE